MLIGLFTAECASERIVKMRRCLIKFRCKLGGSLFLTRGVAAYCRSLAWFGVQLFLRCLLFVFTGTYH